MSRSVQPAKSADATLLYQWDFTSLLQPSETISNAFFSVSVYSGDDDFPSDILSGSPSISGSVVSQLITGGVLGTVYSVDCNALTSLSQDIIISSFVSIIPDLI